MSETPITITSLNDFVFCPLSIYFHSLYGNMNKETYYSTDQINGSYAHASVDNGSYTGAQVIKSLEVYSERYNLIGKIDLYDRKTKTLIERKKRVKTIYDGYVFQLYGQYYAMTEMGYEIRHLVIRSMDDNKRYPIDLPDENENMKRKFEDCVAAFQQFDFSSYVQINPEKCAHCIYAPYCDREV